MPIYEYRCECGNEREVIVTYEEATQSEMCVCGEAMQRKVSLPRSPVIVQTANDMALRQLNKRGNGEFQGMPNRWWKPEAERKAFAGTQRKAQTVW